MLDINFFGLAFINTRIIYGKNKSAPIADSFVVNLNMLLVILKHS